MTKTAFKPISASEYQRHDSLPDLANWTDVIMRKIQIKTQDIMLRIKWVSRRDLEPEPHVAASPKLAVIAAIAPVQSPIPARSRSTSD